MTSRIFEIIPGVIVVELQPGADRFTIFNDPDRPYLSYFTGVDTHRAYLPDGNWQLIGRLSEATEEQAAGMVEKYIYDQCKFRDYEVINSIRINDYKVFPFRSAIPSLHSAIRAAGLFTENPYPTPNCGCLTEYDREGCDEHCWRHVNAQQRTICPERAVILKKI